MNLGLYISNDLSTHKILDNLISTYGKNSRITLHEKSYFLCCERKASAQHPPLQNAKKLQVFLHTFRFFIIIETAELNFGARIKKVQVESEPF